SLAKVWPAVALPPRHWRRFLIDLALFALLSLPWLFLWPQWIDTLVGTSSHPLGPVVPIPWVARGAVAAGLAALRAPGARAPAAPRASPGLYWGQLVVLVAPVSLWLARNDSPSEASPFRPRFRLRVRAL